MPLEETSVRVLAAEDHFRVLCFHLLRHGVERALGLCDIAVALESRSPAFDWTVCVGNNPRHTQWILSVICLARQLLEAEIGDIPFAIKAQQPKWIAKSVLKAWGRSFATHFTQQAPLEFYSHRPQGLGRALAARWPTPIIGTVGMAGSFNGMPRFPYQLGYLIVRSARFLRGRKSLNDEQPHFFGKSTQGRKGTAS